MDDSDGDEHGADAADASGAGTMDGVEVTDCTRCPALVDGRSQIVNGTGPADADLCFVGEAPGEQEDAQGEPFVGRSGGVLDDALAEVGLAREDVRITNCVRCRPPENRDPHVEELANCAGWLEQELAVVDPDLLVTLGKVPAEHLLDCDVAITAEAGSVEEVRIGERTQTLLLSMHPAATLYDRSQRDAFVDTIEKAAELSGEVEGGQADLGSF